MTEPLGCFDCPECDGGRLIAQAGICRTCAGSCGVDRKPPTPMSSNQPTRGSTK